MASLRFAGIGSRCALRGKEGILKRSRFADDIINPYLSAMNEGTVLEHMQTEQ